MPPDEFAEVKKKAGCRQKKADIYKDYVVNCLQTYPDMTAAQIYDWIKKQTGSKDLEFQERAFRNYVAGIRKEYDIKKPEHQRQYEATDNPPFGKHGQVNMEEIKLETISGHTKKCTALQWCFQTPVRSMPCGVNIHGQQVVLGPHQGFCILWWKASGNRL